MALVVVLGSGMLAVAGNAEAQSASFRTAPRYVAGTTPLRIVLADFDLDGEPDVAVANQDSNDVSVFRGDGAGGLGPPASFPVGVRPTSIASADFNGDGRPDLAVTYSGTNPPQGAVAILLGTGSMGFAPATSYSAGANPYSVAVGDFNEDGKADLVVGNFNSPAFILLGDGAGGFAPATALPFGSFKPITLADLNADGHRDIFLLGQYDLKTLLGDGTGAFVPGPSVTFQTPVASVALADVNSDGKADLVAAAGKDLFLGEPGQVWVCLGDGKGGFGSPTSVGSPLIETANPTLVVADLNGDTRPDIAFLADRLAYVMAGDGMGGFAPARMFDAGDSTNSTGGQMTVGDLNGDGRLDLAVASGRVAILLGDGALGFPAAAEAFLPQDNLGGGPMAAADMNGDGKLDLLVSYSGYLAVLLGDGAGRFTHATTVLPGAVKFAVGDLNGDGHPDVAVAGGGTVNVLLGDGQGGLGAPIGYPEGANGFEITVADFDGDGFADVAVANPGASDVSVLRGDGAGHLGPPALFPTACDAARSIDDADFNGDGKLDLGIACQGEYMVPGSVSVLLGDGALGFGPPTLYVAGPSPTTLGLGDFNQDGKTDLAVANHDSPVAHVYMLLGDGSGGFVAGGIFASTSQFSVYTGPDLVVADFNADQKLDLADSDTRDVSVLVGDGAGSFAAPLVVPSGGSLVSGDFDGDGRPDLAVGYAQGVAILMNTSAPPLATDLAIAVDDGVTTVVPGSSVSYVIHVTNNGPTTLTSLKVNDATPQLVSPVFTPASGTYNPSTGVWTGLSLPGGSSVTLTLMGTVSPTAVGTLVNTASVTTPAGVVDPMSGNNVATDTDTVTPAADVAVSQTDSADPVHPLDAFSYTVTVTNHGGVAATNVVLTDSLPAAATFVSSSPGAPTCAVASGTLSCALGTLAVGTSSVVTINVTANANYTEAVNIASVASDLFDPIASNNSVEEHTLFVLGIGYELTHGGEFRRNLAAAPGPEAAQDLFRIGQAPYSSYEVVVDAATGDIGAGGLSLQRLAPDLTTVLQDAVPVTSGSSLSLRFENASAVREDGQPIRVTSPGCTTECGPEDTYRIRADETTGSIPRFNNSGTQHTILLLENLAAHPVSGHLWFWDGQGALLGSQAFSIEPHALFVLNTITMFPNTSGSITISHDGRYGDLSGKAVALEASTGFTFDTPVRLRPR